MLPPPLLGADELTKCPKNLSRISCSDLADTAILAQKASKTRKQIQTNPLFSSLTHTLPIADKTEKNGSETGSSARRIREIGTRNGSVN